MGILKQINELAEKITGTNPNKKEIAKALDYIEQGYTAGGGGSSAESDLFVITGTYNEGTYTIDKTYQEINEAYEQNKILLLDLQIYMVFLNSSYSFDDPINIKFAGQKLSVVNNKLYSDVIEITYNNGFSMTTTQYTLTPASSTPVSDDLA